MIVVTSEHAGHDPDRLAPTSDTRRYWEVPDRADTLLATVRNRGFSVRPAVNYGLDPIARVHDHDYLAFLAEAFVRWQMTPAAGPALRAAAFAVRHASRRPETLLGQAGYYLSSLSAPILAATWPAAISSAHAAVTAADLLLKGEPAVYALCRPPGHHAHTDMAGGFCYLNNAAIAAQRLLDGGQAPVAIFDFDVHHGNGTQQIFYERDDVFYVSVHGDPAQLYPYYAGYADEIGHGHGQGWNLNLPLPPGTGDAGFISAAERGIDAISRKRPAALVVSVGFDAHAGDPTANLAVSSAAFKAIGQSIRGLGRPALLVQEGGYIVERLAENLHAFLTGCLG